LVEVNFPADIAGHAEGGVSICKVRSDVNFVGRDFFKAYCARNALPVWEFFHFLRGLTDSAKTLMIGQLVLGSE